MRLVNGLSVVHHGSIPEALTQGRESRDQSCGAHSQVCPKLHSRCQPLTFVQGDSVSTVPRNDPVLPMGTFLAYLIPIFHRTRYSGFRVWPFGYPQ